nr:MAG TPA: hypothetical protein [Crassvirales sp.]
MLLVLKDVIGACPPYLISTRHNKSLSFWFSFNIADILY